MTWGTAAAIVLGGVFTLAGGAVGVLGALILDRRREDRNDVREEAARRTVLHDQKHAFELTELFACQQALDDCNARLLQAKTQRSAEKHAQLADSVFAAMSATNRHARMLLDGRLRELVHAAGSAVGTAVPANFRPHDEAASRAATTAVLDAQPGIATAIRHIYQGM
jgi:hypothetical protein